MDDFSDDYLSKTLKNWVARSLLPAKGRSRLLQAARRPRFTFPPLFVPALADDHGRYINWSYVNGSWESPALLQIDMTFKRLIG